MFKVHCGTENNGCKHYSQRVCECSCCPTPLIKDHKVLMFVSVKEPVVSNSKLVTLTVPSTSQDGAAKVIEDLLQALINAGGVEFIKRTQVQIIELEKIKEYIVDNEKTLFQISEPTIDVGEKE